MCGIVGQVGGSPLDLEGALHAIRHRGPDDRGTWRGQRGETWVDLGFVRLAIIDLSPTGHQPMGNDDGSIQLIFNGEVYNYPELRQELIQLGYRFRSTSDTEVVLHAYEQYGEAFVHRLRGMFALALWDSRKGKLLLVRDRLGIKPLFWAEHQGHLIFGSEMKALLALGVPKTLDPQGMDSYLRYLYIHAPLTIFKEVHRLPPANMLIWEDGKQRIEPYWDLGQEPEVRDRQTIVQQLRETLEEVVEQHLASDVPLGAFLSGGVDSTTLVALMARHSSRPIKTFCMTFDEGAELYDERAHARTVAEAYGTEHTEIPVKPDLMELLPTAIRHFDEPFGNPTALLVYLLSKETRKHVTVALAGDGGDEVFLGYPRYQGAWMAQLLVKAPRPARTAMSRLSSLIRDSTRGDHRLRRAREFLGGANKPLEAMYESWVGYYDDDHLDALLQPAHRRPRPETTWLGELFGRAPARRDGAWDFLDRVTYVDLKSFLPSNLLQYSDRMSMAHGLEVRVPFCDHRLVELMASIPSSQKMPHLEAKALLKDAVGELLPPSIRSRPKLGFNPPVGLWLNRELRPLVEEQLAPSRLAREGFFDPSEVQRMLTLHRAGKRDYSLHLWALIVFQTWMQLYQGA